MSQRIAENLGNWLRQEAAQRNASAHSRRSAACIERECSDEDRRIAHKMAERALGRRIPKTTRSQDEESAAIQEKIATKLESEAAMILRFADSLSAAEAERDGLRRVLAEILDLVPHNEYEENRCQVCGWPLSASPDQGCVPGNCCYRPGDHSDEWPRLKRQRKWVNAKAALRRQDEPAA